MNELITLLQQNARLSNAQLAVMLGKTEDEIAKEIKE
ncbi:MAG: AsnC family protein, partial [Ruminococcus sp.]|nr:AsnC family protein [Ruminococcus sp.]